MKNQPPTLKPVSTAVTAVAAAGATSPKLPDSAGVTSVVMAHTSHEGSTTIHVGSWENFCENHSAWLSDDQSIRTLADESAVREFADWEFADADENADDECARRQAIEKAHFLKKCAELGNARIGFFRDSCAVFETVGETDISFSVDKIISEISLEEWEARELARVSDDAGGNQRTRFLTADDVAKEWEELGDEARTHWKILEPAHAAALDAFYHPEDDEDPDTVKCMDCGATVAVDDSETDDGGDGSRCLGCAQGDRDRRQDENDNLSGASAHALRAGCDIADARRVKRTVIVPGSSADSE